MCASGGGKCALVRSLFKSVHTFTHACFVSLHPFSLLCRSVVQLGVVRALYTVSGLEHGNALCIKASKGLLCGCVSLFFYDLFTAYLYSNRISIIKQTMKNCKSRQFFDNGAGTHSFTFRLSQQGGGVLTMHASTPRGIPSQRSTI